MLKFKVDENLPDVPRQSLGTRMLGGGQCETASGWFRVFSFILQSKAYTFRHFYSSFILHPSSF
ncbi:MAG: hypothetical protein ABSA16_13225 [Thermoguttaceae bacterium]|jgi:hypothetical protein